VHSQLAEVQAEFGREKKQRERLEVQCHDLEREIESVKRSGSRPSQNAETAKEVAKYAYTVESALVVMNASVQ